MEKINRIEKLKQRKYAGVPKSASGMCSWEKWLHKAEKKLGMLIGAGGLFFIISFLTSLNSWDYLKFQSNKFINKSVLSIVWTYLCKKNTKTKTLDENT